MPDAIEILNMDKDESEVSQSIKEKVSNTLDEDVFNVTTQQREDHDEEDSMRIKGIDY